MNLGSIVQIWEVETCPPPVLTTPDPLSEEEAASTTLGGSGRSGGRHDPVVSDRSARGGRRVSRPTRRMTLGKVPGTPRQG